MKKAMHLIVIAAVVVFIVAAVGFSFVGCKAATPATTAPETTVAPETTTSETTVAPETTAPETTVAPETTAAPETTS